MFGGDPEMALGPVRLQRGRLAAGVDARSRMRAAFGVGRVAAQPVVDARQLPGRVEVARVAPASVADQISAARRALARLARSAYNASAVARELGREQQRRYRIGGCRMLIRKLLADLGEDPAREGLRDTPKRVEKAYKFLTSGYSADIDQVLNNALFTRRL